MKMKTESFLRAEKRRQGCWRQRDWWQRCILCTRLEFEVDEFPWFSHKITRKGGGMGKTRTVLGLLAILTRVAWGCSSCTHWARIWESKRKFLSKCLSVALGPEASLNSQQITVLPSPFPKSSATRTVPESYYHSISSQHLHFLDYKMVMITVNYKTVYLFQSASTLCSRVGWHVFFFFWSIDYLFFLTIFRIFGCFRRNQVIFPVEFPTVLILLITPTGSCLSWCFIT